MGRCVALLTRRLPSVSELFDTNEVKQWKNRLTTRGRDRIFASSEIDPPLYSLRLGIGSSTDDTLRHTVCPGKFVGGQVME